MKQEHLKDFKKQLGVYPALVARLTPRCHARVPAVVPPPAAPAGLLALVHAVAMVGEEPTMKETAARSGDEKGGEPNGTVAGVAAIVPQQQAASMECSGEVGWDGGGTLVDGAVPWPPARSGTEVMEKASENVAAAAADDGDEERAEGDGWQECKQGCVNLMVELATNPRYQRLVWSVAHAGGAGAGAGAGAGETSSTICSQYSSEGYSAMNQDATRNKAYENGIIQSLGGGIKNRVLEVGTGASALLTCMVLRRLEDAHVVRCVLIFYW